MSGGTDPGSSAETAAQLAGNCCLVSYQGGNRQREIEEARRKGGAAGAAGPRRLGTSGWARSQELCNQSKLVAGRGQ